MGRKTHEEITFRSWDNELPLPVFPWSLSVIIVAISGAICFLNSLSGDFVFDDSEAILNNNDIKTATPLINIFYNDFWGTRLTHPSSHKSYRPLTVLSFSYHLMNIGLHCAVSVASLYVFGFIFGKSSAKASLMAAVLFAVHPVHTEAVAGIVGRADLLCAFFVFLAFLFYVKAVTSYKDYISSNSSEKSKMCKIFFVCASLSTGVAMLCKEVGITALGLCSAFDVFVSSSGVMGKIFISSFAGERLSAISRWRNLPAGVFKGFVTRHVFLFATGIALLASRWAIMGSTVPKFMKVDNPASFLENPSLRAVNYQYLYGINGFLMLLPVWLCFDWSMGCIPLIQSFWDFRMLTILLFWVTVFLMVWKGCITQGQTGRCILMSLSVSMIPFLPASNLFFRVGFVVAERVLYIPVAGLCILVVAGLRELGTCPFLNKVHYNIGKVAADRGEVDEAVFRYREALRLNTEYDQAMNNLANILKDQGHLDEALTLLKKATSLRPDFAAAWMNLGIVEASLGWHYEAKNSYQTALSLRSVYPDCLYNLGNLYLEMGDHALALQTWKNATSLKPSLAVAWTNILILLDSQGKYKDAIAVAGQALSYLPNEPALHFNLANTLGKQNQFELSERHFVKATVLDSGNGSYWANLGVLYHRWRKYELAERAYRRALKLNPSLKAAQDNLNKLLKTVGSKTGV